MAERHHLDAILRKLFVAPGFSEADETAITASDVDAAPDSSVDRDIELLITDSLGIDPAQYRLTLETLRAEMTDCLCRAVADAAKRERDAAEIFEARKGDILARTLGRDLGTYEVLFPLPSRVGQSVGHAATVLGKPVETVADEDVTEQLAGTVTGAALGTGGDVEQATEVFSRSAFDTWRISVEARDEAYAFEQARSILKYFCGKLNFLGVRWHACRWSSRDGEMDATTPGMSEPPVFLVAVPNEGLEETDAVVHEVGEPQMGTPTNLASRRLDRYDDLPSLPPKSELDDRDGDVYTAFRAYQKGMTSQDSNSAFFAFWRGLEALCTQSGHSNAQMVDRARAILRTFSGEKLGNPEHRTGYLETTLPRIRDAMAGLADRRNTMVHTGPQIGISSAETNAVRLLLEAYLEGYAEFYDEYEGAQFEAVFDGLAMSRAERRTQIEALEARIERIEETQALDRRQDQKSVDHLRSNRR